MALHKSCRHGSLSNDQTKPRLSPGFCNRIAMSLTGMPGDLSQWPAKLVFRYNALNIVGLASDAIADAPVSFDRHARNDGVDIGADVLGTALRPLMLMTNIVVLGVNMRHPIRPVGLFDSAGVYHC
jgi:hypothetical protein